jgi:hypothetical protein
MKSPYMAMLTKMRELPAERALDSPVEETRDRSQQRKPQRNSQ